MHETHAQCVSVSMSALSGSRCYLPVVQASLFQLMHMSHDDHAQPMKCAMVSLSVHVQSLQ